MVLTTNERNVNHLIESILTRNNSIPNYALLLGSGASVSSHVISARDMIGRWRRRLYENNGAPEKYGDWLKKQDWYDTDDEYAILFERMFDQPSLRRAFIEEELINAHPSWGYVYLTNLLKQNIFNVAFTVNFDDLIQEACYLYSDLRPIVCAHDSAISGVRVTSARPKVIKLHGDYLFDNIKNTVRELETLEENMKRKFIQFAQEYGLVVIGYSGRDRSVMDILDMLVKQDDYFQQGIYWCMRPSDTKGTRLSSLLRRDKVYTVNISGFDEFMARLNKSAGLGLPDPVANPIWIAEDRTKLFLNIPEKVRSNEIIANDIDKVLKTVNDIMSLSEEPKVSPLLIDRLPPSLRAAVLIQQRELEKALDELRKAYDDDPDDPNIAYEIADTLAKLNRRDELKDFVPDSPLSAENKTYFLLHTHDDEAVISTADRVISNDPSSEIARINRAISLKRLGRLVQMEEELLNIESLNPLDDICSGIAALRKDKTLMLELMEKSLKDSLLTTDNIEMFPVFEGYWEDEDLLKLVDKWKRKDVDKRKKRAYSKKRKEKTEEV